MPRVHGGSKGCRSCRKRKIKCDEKKPICGHCSKANLQCGGWRDIFHHSTVNDWASSQPVQNEVAQSDVTKTVNNGPKCIDFASARAIGKTIGHGPSSQSDSALHKKQYPSRSKVAEVGDVRTPTELVLGRVQSQHVDCQYSHVTSIAPGFTTIVKPPDVSKGGDQFHSFVKLTMSYLGPGRSQHLWFHGYLPAAQRYEAILSGILCFSTLYLLPLDKSTESGVPAKAIAWYCESLQKPFTDLPLMLLATTLYMQIEARMMHYQNRNNLLRAAFALIHSARLLQSRKLLQDRLLFDSIHELMASLFDGTADGTCIPTQHWRSAVEVIHCMADGLQIGFPLIMEVDLFDIEFSLQNRLVVIEVMWLRMKTYLDTVATYRASIPEDHHDQSALKRLVTRLEMLEMQAHFEHWRDTNLITSQQLYLSRAKELLRKLESKPDLSRSKSPLLSCYLDQGPLPSAIEVAWYYREDYTYDRIESYLRKYFDLISYSSNFMKYVKILVSTPMGIQTKLESRLFGTERNMVLRGWHACRLSNALARWICE